jgi:hypothetical protein
MGYERNLRRIEGIKYTNTSDFVESYKAKPNWKNRVFFGYFTQEFHFRFSITQQVDKDVWKVLEIAS